MTAKYHGGTGRQFGERFVAFWAQLRCFFTVWKKIARSAAAGSVRRRTGPPELVNRPFMLQVRRLGDASGTGALLFMAGRLCHAGGSGLAGRGRAWRWDRS
jgi:hypothetical protein